MVKKRCKFYNNWLKPSAPKVVSYRCAATEKCHSRETLLRIFSCLNNSEHSWVSFLSSWFNVYSLLIMLWLIDREM